MQVDFIEETQITPSLTEPFVADYNIPQQPQPGFADRNGAYHLSDPSIPPAIPLTGFPPRHENQLPEHQMGIYREVNGIPAFFEQVMLPPSTSPCPGFQGVQQPRGVFDFMRDPEFTSPDGGLFNFDTITDLDIILGSDTANLGPGAPIDDQSAKQRVAAFRRSLWFVDLYLISKSIHVLTLYQALDTRKESKWIQRRRPYPPRGWRYDSFYI